MKQKQSAFILPTLVLLLSILSLLIVTGFSQILSHTTLVHGSIRSDTAEILAEQDLMQQLGSDTNALLSPGIFCPTATQSTIYGAIKRSTCLRIGSQMPSGQFLSESSFSNPWEFPLIDIQFYLRNLSPCNLTPFAPSDTTTSGFTLTPSAQRAAFSCQLAPALITDQFTTMANLEPNFDIATQISTLPNAIIASSGFIDIPLNLKLSSDLLMISAGDIHIGVIASDAPFQITAVSLSGFIKIDTISGAVALKAWGRAGVSAPAANLSSLNPKLLRSIILGMSS